MAEEINKPEQNNSEVAKERNTETHTVYYDLYDHGFINGILRIPRETFAQFLNHLGKRDLSKKELGITLQEIRVLEDKIRQNRDKRLELENIISASKWEMEAAKELRDITEQAILLKKAEHDKTSEEKKQIIIEYNWASVILFILMGILFMISDFFITLDAMHRGLNQELKYAVPLALAISAVTFVIKPTIDRLFEKPYLRGDNKLKHYLLLSVSVLAIFVLGILGYFREIHVSSASQIDSIKSEINDKEEEIDELESKINRALNRNDTTVSIFYVRINELNNTIINLEKNKREITHNKNNNISILLIFILSNILFAVAAAICLSIAFPAADRLRLQKRLAKKLEQIEAAITLQKLEINNLIEKAKDILTARDKAGNELKLMPDLSNMEATLIQLQSISKILLQRIGTHDTEADIALYNEAFARGSVCELSDKIVINPPQLTAVWVSGRRPKGKTPPGDGNGVPDSAAEPGYLHQQIRKIIEYNHQKNKNMLNGEE